MTIHLVIGAPKEHKDFIFLSGDESPINIRNSLANDWKLKTLAEDTREYWFSTFSIPVIDHFQKILKDSDNQTEYGFFHIYDANTQATISIKELYNELFLIQSRISTLYDNGFI